MIGAACARHQANDKQKALGSSAFLLAADTTR
jgi:hypothetical protein